MLEYTITKSAGGADSADSTPTAEDLALISRFTRKTPDAKDIYTFTVTLCDNEIDRDNERFSISALNKLKGMFEGVTGIFDHSMKSCDQTARIFKTEVVTDDTVITSCGEPYTRLKAWCYMLRTEKNSGLIGEIDAGIKKEVSISCSVRSRLCSVCGKDMRLHECCHTQGETVNGKVCHAILSDPSDAYEWSFVAVPAQRNAGVSKSAKKTSKSGNKPTVLEFSDPTEIIKSLSKEIPDGGVALNSAQLKSLAGYIARIEEEADCARERRKIAEKEIIALSAFTLPDADTKMLTSILGKLENNEVFMLRKAFERKSEDMEVFLPVFRSENVKNFNDNSQFKI